MTTQRILIIPTADPRSSSADLFTALGQGLRTCGGVSVETLSLAKPAGTRWGKLVAALPRWRTIAAVRKADVVVVHTSVAFAAGPILLARLFGKRVFVIYWDVYPDSFAPLGQPLPKRHAPFGWLEHGLLRLATKIMPPSSDYLPALARLGLAHKAQVFAMWPFTPVIPAAPQRPGGDRPLEIGFSGAVNPIRGLDTALRRIAANCSGPVMLHCYGHQAAVVPPDLANGPLTICNHGHVAQDLILDRLAQHDLGLMPLSELYACPAFPSKAISYVCAGLPILYVGPSLPALQTFLTTNGTGLVLGDGPIDLVSAAFDLRAGLSGAKGAQATTIGQIALNEARIAAFLQ